MGCTNLKTVTCLATTPPTTSPYLTDYYSFEDRGDKTLYVPEASLDAYKSAREWKEFGKILPITTTDIQTVNEGKIDLASNNGTLILSNVSNNESANVYSTSGVLLGSGKGSISVKVRSGQIVIVKVGNQSRKVMVK